MLLLKDAHIQVYRGVPATKIYEADGNVQPIRGNVKLELLKYVGGGALEMQDGDLPTHRIFLDLPDPGDYKPQVLNDIIYVPSSANNAYVSEYSLVLYPQDWDSLLPITYMLLFGRFLGVKKIRDTGLDNSFNVMAGDL
jgi:hypothetical protein